MEFSLSPLRDERMDKPILSDVVASLLHKLEPFNLPKYKFPPDLKYNLIKLKDLLPHVLDPSHTHEYNIYNSVFRVNELLGYRFDVKSSIVEDDEEEEWLQELRSSRFDEKEEVEQWFPEEEWLQELRSSRFIEEEWLQELRSIISQLSPLFKTCDILNEITEFELPKNVKQLPHHLFRLCIFCSIYPKGHRFVKETLVTMWEAQDLLERTTPDDNMEGTTAAGELLSRGIFEEPVFIFGSSSSSSRRVYSFKMNPVVHDAVRRLAAKEIAIFDTRNPDGNPSSSAVVGQQTKHIAFYNNSFSRFNMDKVIQNCKNATSLMFSSLHWDAFYSRSASRTVRRDNLRNLCVLDLCGRQFKELPHVELASLRYLSLSGNVLLKTFILSFFPILETLAVEGCVNVDAYVSQEHRSLQNLYWENSGWRWLIPNTFCIRVLEFSHREPFDLGSTKLALNILRIFHCPSPRMLWMLSSSLEELVLHDCEGLQLHEAWLDLKLPNLKRLELVHLPITQMPHALQSAKALEYFMIAECPQLEELETVQYLTSLQELYIYYCPNLRSLPYNKLHSLPNLTLLDIRDCPNITGRHSSRFPNIKEKFSSAIPSLYWESFAADRGKSKVPGLFRLPASPSISNGFQIYIDGQFQKFSLSQGPNDQIASHLDQSDPYFVAKSRMYRTGVLIKKNHWNILALVLKAITRMKTIVNLGREQTKLHCCLFPADYEFERETLVQLWMAVGILDEKFTEDAGNCRFDALLEKQYILPSRVDILTGRSIYKVNFDKVTTHLNEMQLRTIKSKDFYALLLEGENVPSKFWHVSMVSNHFDQATFETLMTTFNELRTLLFLRNYGSSLKQIPSGLFIALKSIQALDLSGSHITELPSSIGNVIQLRYLDLSFTLIESLPDSIDRLHQLQTLKLEGCKYLYNLPDGMKDLTCLRYLEFDVLGQLTCMPKGIGALTELRTLSAFIVDSGESSSIRELKKMNNLTGRFCISGLENASPQEVREATLSNKKYLTWLQLRWNDFISYDDQRLQDIHRATYHLEPSLCLEELQMLHYPGLKLPLWIGSTRFKKLFSITLFKCAIEELPIKLGKLPNLRYLNLTFMYRLTYIDYKVHTYTSEDLGSFPKLEALRIDGMPILETWDGVRHGDFPLISKLIVKQCPKLSVLPFLPYLPSLKHLEISHCKVIQPLSDGPTLPPSLATLVIDTCPLLKKRYMRGAEGWSEIEHISEITIDLKDVRSTQEGDTDDDTSSTGSNLDSDYSEDSDGNNIHSCDSCYR